MSQYGWFILLGLVVLLYVWYKIRPSFQEWQRKQRDLEDERNFGMSPHAYVYIITRAHCVCVLGGGGALMHIN